MQNTQATIDQFITRNQIRMTWETTFETDGWEVPNTRHFKVTLHANSKSWTVFYHLGSASKGGPKLADVLDSLAMDCSGYDSAQGSFEFWAESYGYSTDSRKAEKLFLAVGEERDELIRLLGQNEYKVLVEETERL